MNRLSGSSFVALAVAAFLASLSVVAWRQARAMEELVRLDEYRQERALALSQRTELMRRIQELESRSRITAAARGRLGMIQPHDSSIVIMDTEGP